MTGAAANDWASHGVPNSLLLEKPFAPACDSGCSTFERPAFRPKLDAGRVHIFG
jgi:hypothetical protein